MKELTKKVIEAGLIDKHTTHLFEKWGAIDPEEADQVKRKEATKKTLEEFAEAIDGLMATSYMVKETQFEAYVTGPYNLRHEEDGPITQCYKDPFGRYLIKSTEIEPFTRGDSVYIDGRERQLLDFEILYKGDKPSMLQLLVED